MFTLVIILKVWAIEGWLVCACVCLCSVIIADTASVATVALVSVSELGPGSWHDLSPGQPQHSGDLTRELWSRSNVILQLHFDSKLAFSYLMKPIWRQYANSSVIKHWDVQSFLCLVHPPRLVSNPAWWSWMASMSSMSGGASWS